MMKELLNKFCITDGRPWYKQIITGCYKCSMGLVFGFFAFVVLSVLYYATLDIGFAQLAVSIVGLILSLAAILACLLLLVAGYLWAEEKL